MKTTGRLPAGALLVGALALFWLGAIIPGMLASQRLPGELALVRKKLDDKRAERTQRVAAGKTADKLTEVLGDLINAKGEADHLGHLVREAHRVTMAAGVKVISIQPLAPTVRGDFKKHPVQLNVEGNLKSVKELLLLLRDARPLLDPERVTMRTASDSKKITAQLTIASYAWAPKEKAKRRAT